MWAREIFEELCREAAAEDSQEDVWYECSEWPEEVLGQHEETIKTPEWSTDKLDEATPPKRSADVMVEELQLASLDLGAPQLPVEKQRGSTDLSGTREGSARAFAFVTCWLCGAQGCSCESRRKQRKKAKRVRWQRKEQQRCISEQWEETAMRVRSVIRVEGAWRRVVEGWVAFQFERRQEC